MKSKSKKISWGVLSTARIGLDKVIPAMQKGKYSEINAIASREIVTAQKAAKKLGIPKAYGSYEAILNDKEIDAVYISLPNHLHVEWTIKSLKAGKHVLCEKPLGLDFKEVVYLKKKAGSFPSLKVMEAFMYRHHPQWRKVKELISKGKIGQLKTVQAIFSYYNDNPADIRNQADIGGGGLLDIGCYCISVSRLLFNNEPGQVCGSIEYDPKLKTDRLVSGVLQFDNGTSTFTCSTQLTNHQHVSVFGTQGRIEIETPFTPLPNQSSKILLYKGGKIKEIVFKPCNQYTIQGDLFSQAILNDSDVPTPLEDGVANMKVIDGVLKSSERKAWINL
jgi:predicted dehydrogenase